MNHLNAVAKKNARAALAGNWGKSMAIILLAVAISLLFSLSETILMLVLDLPGFSDIMATPGYFLDDLPSAALPSMAMTILFTILALLVLCPLHLGILQWHFNLTCGQSDEITSIFFFFESLPRMLRALWLRLNVVIRTAFWSGLFLAPGSLLIWMGGNLIRPTATGLDRIMATIGLTMGSLLFLLGLVEGWLFSFRYFLAPFILCADPSVSARRAIRQSIAVTKGNRLELAGFHLSFFGWMLTLPLILPVLYVAPYYCTAKAIYARYLLEREGVLSHSETEEVPDREKETHED